MAKIEQYSRIINHALTTAGQNFTVPVSNDHTDETWLASDLYIGEFGVNLTDDKVYVRTNIRNDSNIKRDLHLYLYTLDAYMQSLENLLLRQTICIVF